MFDFGQIIELLKIEPGHNLLQSALLFMIWWSSRGIKKGLDDMRVQHETRFEKIEERIIVLEEVKE